MNNKKIIKSFTIKGLFGTTDIQIPFEDNVKILIGENGMGKTQILNILYYTLTQRFEKLIDFNFECIIIEFKFGKSVKLYKENIKYSNPEINSIVEKVGINRYLKIQERASSISVNNYLEMKNIADEFEISTNFLLKILRNSTNNKSNNLLSSNLNAYVSLIKEQLSGFQILYFPTYRRVEEELFNLGYNEDRFIVNEEDAKLINFGMKDVDNRFNKLTKQIERFSTEGLSKISSEILSHLVKGLPAVDDNFLKTINEQDIEIILARVGNQITVEDKLRIKEIVIRKEIQDKDHSLLYFLQKLINIYDQQRELDDSIKVFRDVCNKYLYNKKVIYEESKIEIYIQSEESGEKLPLSKLSSGEKQIISIFAKIYLSPPECNFIVLFDEPELSLSIFWQRNLLPDIYNSGKCPFLFAVTHSPFIFENDLDKYAVALSQYLTPSKLVLA